VLLKSASFLNSNFRILEFLEKRQQPLLPLLKSHGGVYCCEKDELLVFFWVFEPEILGQVEMLDLHRGVVGVGFA